tara:strand:+ start:204 stop:1055 length:852 start_codon:yes stop_codon:yes gene_type:complete
MDKIDIAFIGGSGLYNISDLRNQKWIDINSNFGTPSDSICVGELNNNKIAFLPRHGRKHNIAPSKINYKANIECLKKIGVSNIISISAVGSLRNDYKPGDFVLVDQFIDKTYLRSKTFFEEDIVAHIPFANPICTKLNNLLDKVLSKLGISYHSSGTYICIEGPQFSTLAESELYRSWGCDIIGMTNMPEAKLAREAGICYSSLAMVTDFDCWHPDHEKVTIEQIISTLNENSSKALKVVEEVSKCKNLNCSQEIKNLIKNSIVTDLSNVNKKILEKYKIILD